MLVRQKKIDSSFSLLKAYYTTNSVCFFTSIRMFIIGAKHAEVLG